MHPSDLDLGKVSPKKLILERVVILFSSENCILQ